MSKRLQYINLCACAVFIALVFFIVRLQWWYYSIPVVVLFAGFISEQLRQGILWLWLKFSGLLGKINSSIVLFIIYFFIITPYAVLFRKKLGVNYQKQKQAGAVSMFKTRNHTVQPTDFEKSW